MVQLTFLRTEVCHTSDGLSLIHPHPNTSQMFQTSPWSGKILENYGGGCHASGGVLSRGMLFPETWEGKKPRDGGWTLQSQDWCGQRWTGGIGWLGGVMESEP
jgi:hypothetical protein